MHKHLASGLEYKTAFLNVSKGAALKSVESGRLKGKQLDAIKRGLLRTTKKDVKLEFKVFPWLSITKKPAEVRMGKGKGAIDQWVAPIRAGQIICEITSDHVPLSNLIKMLNRVKTKVGLQTKVIFLNYNL